MKAGGFPNSNHGLIRNNNVAAPFNMHFLMLKMFLTTPSWDQNIVSVCYLVRKCSLQFCEENSFQQQASEVYQRHLHFQASLVC